MRAGAEARRLNAASRQPVTLVPGPTESPELALPPKTSAH
ncbi:uncharacterized protein BCN122_II1207 [Burkholderia cenocepacia]|nr:uncharacterized protein BCN122_II1207 [Burkholderia cenocepacia]